jgi:hypothetical protein
MESPLASASVIVSIRVLVIEPASRMGMLIFSARASISSDLFMVFSLV